MKRLFEEEKIKRTAPDYLIIILGRLLFLSVVLFFAFLETFMTSISSDGGVNIITVVFALSTVASFISGLMIVFNPSGILYKTTRFAKNIRWVFLGSISAFMSIILMARFFAYVHSLFK